ncbi:MAG: ATP-binding cassette domain-containing protein [Bdellovibrionales bacterium]
MSAIEVRNLRKVFSRAKRPPGLIARIRSSFRPQHDHFVAVDDIDFKVNEGEALAFIGPNGAGKSTTIKMLTGILHPTSGEASVLGQVPWRDRTQLSFRIGSVFGQKSQLWLHLPPRDTFDLLSRIYELKRSDYLTRRDELVKAFELDDIIDVPVRKLSLGQRMRCEVAASLLHRPKIIFLDEPTIGLDPVAKAAIRELIKRANKEDGVTVFLTSHDAGDIERLCRRVIIINHGRLIFDDSTNRLRREFLRTKEIDLKLSAPWENGIELEGVTVLKAKNFGVKLTVDTAKQSIQSVVSRLLERSQVEDITIQNLPLEDIIMDIYRRQAVSP